MFPVRNFISRATVWKGSILMGASGGGDDMTFCATWAAAAQDDWFRRREGWWRLGVAFFCVCIERARAALR